MYAVVSTGGKQYRVEAGTTLDVERLAAEPGQTVTFDRVLLVGDGDEVTVGTPTVAGATVSGTVLGAERGPKLIIFKFKSKARYRRRNGHRQHLTRVRIDAIEADGQKAKRAPTPSAAAKTSTAEDAPAEKPTRSSRAATASKAAPRRKTASARKSTASSTEEAPVEKKAPARRRTTTRKPKAEAEE